MLNTDTYGYTQRHAYAHTNIFQDCTVLLAKSMGSDTSLSEFQS